MQPARIIIPLPASRLLAHLAPCHLVSRQARPATQQLRPGQPRPGQPGPGPSDPSSFPRFPRFCSRPPSTLYIGACCCSSDSSSSPESPPVHSPPPCRCRRRRRRRRRPCPPTLHLSSDPSVATTSRWRRLSSGLYLVRRFLLLVLSQPLAFIDHTFASLLPFLSSRPSPFPFPLPIYHEAVHLHLSSPPTSYLGWIGLDHHWNGGTHAPTYTYRETQTQTQADIQRGTLPQLGPCLALSCLVLAVLVSTLSQFYPASFLSCLSQLHLDSATAPPIMS